MYRWNWIHEAELIAQAGTNDAGDDETKYWARCPGDSEPIYLLSSTDVKQDEDFRKYVENGGSFARQCLALADV